MSQNLEFTLTHTENGAVMKSVALLLMALATGVQAQLLTLEPPVQPVLPEGIEISVGADTMARFENEFDIHADLPAPPGLTLDSNIKPGKYVRAPMKLPGFIDADGYNHAGFQSQVVRLMAPGQVAPFASLAHENGRGPMDEGRVGAGAGAKWNLSPNANFGTEVLVFPSSATSVAGDALKGANTKVMTRLELKF